MIRNECDCAIYRILCAKRYHILERCGVVLIWPCATLRKTNYALLFFPLGWLLSSFSASFAFYLSFFLLRVRTNGYHSKTFAGCLLFSVCSECVLFLLILPNLRAIALLWVLASSTITIFLFAPYDHPNLHMTKEELAASKHMAMLTVLILDMALILSLSMQFYAFANGLALGLGFTAFLLIMEYGKQIYEKEICKQWKTKK